MKKFSYCLSLLVMVVNIAFAADAVPIQLERVKVDATNRESVLRGAQFYAQNCMVCHTMKYLAHDKLAKEAGVTLDKMPLKEQEWVYGVVPPDLTLVARRHTPAWIYTYLHAFYRDDKRPTGYNNLLMPNTVMMNILAGLQGQQVLTEQGKTLLKKGSWRKPHYFNVLELTQQGSLTPEQFNQVTMDLVNFFVYAGDPERPMRVMIGIFVILFLLVFLLLAWLLKRAYWQDVKK